MESDWNSFSLIINTQYLWNNTEICNSKDSNNEILVKRFIQPAVFFSSFFLWFTFSDKKTFPFFPENIEIWKFAFCFTTFNYSLNNNIYQFIKRKCIKKKCSSINGNLNLINALKQAVI